MNSIPYIRQAYEVKKYAFVSDYARFKILYEYGGLYFDTDVEVIRPIDDIIARGAFMGFEVNSVGHDAGKVNPGLGIGSYANNGLYKELIAEYATRRFINEDGSYNQTTIVTYVTELLVRNGLKAVDGIQQVAGVTIYPSDYFNPLDDNTGRLNITPNTISIHWYSKTWLEVSPMRVKCSRLFHRIFGVDAMSRIRKLFGQ